MLQARWGSKPTSLSMLDLMQTPADPQPFVDQVFEAFERSGLVLEPFDRFRS